MNEYDTELVRAILSEAQFHFTEKEAEADLILLNTCSVRENAHNKVFGKIQSLRHQYKNKPLKIGILGCMATGLKEDLINDPHHKIDIIAGPDSYKELPELIHQAFGTNKQSYHIDLSEFETYGDVYPQREEGVNAWIAVMRGCNNFCSFCIVPYTRGRERSRNPNNILDEAKRLADEGFKQVTLLGQNVNSYNFEGTSFAQLLNQVSEIEGIERIRFTSPHPKDFPDDLIDVIANNPKVCKQIHLPLQAGNDRVLQIMNRNYTQEDFLKLVDKIRAKCPLITFSTDIIIGFPTETDEEFEDTYKVMEHVEFDSAFIFKYSVRKGTTASEKYQDDVSEKDKTKRIVRLNDLQKKITLKSNEKDIGKTLPILVENIETKNNIIFGKGRTDSNKMVSYPNASTKEIGQIIPIKITEASPHILRGEKG